MLSSFAPLIMLRCAPLILQESWQTILLTSKYLLVLALFHNFIISSKTLRAHCSSAQRSGLRRFINQVTTMKANATFIRWMVCFYLNILKLTFALLFIVRTTSMFSNRKGKIFKQIVFRIYYAVYTFFLFTVKQNFDVKLVFSQQEI